MEAYQQNHDIWTLHVNDRYFRANTLTKKIIEHIVDGLSNNDIKQELIYSGFGEIQDEEINVLRSSITAIPNKNSKQNAIRGRLTILNLEKWQPLLRVLSFLFNPIFATIVVVLFVLLFIFQYSVISNISKAEVLENIKGQPYMLLVYTTVSLAIVLLHEFGHAVAALKYRVSPKEIGFGFYLYFPVFYTDVSKAWLASRRQRIVIDVAGYYFQIISMTVLLIISLIIEAPSSIIQLLVWDNVLIIIYNLNPLFRFDGYWLFSDIFDITNLRQKANAAFPELLLAITGKCKFSNRFRPSIYVYSVISNIFIVTMLCLFLIFIIRNFTNMTQFDNTKDYILWSLKTLKTLIILIAGYYAFRSAYSLIKNIAVNGLQLLREDKVADAEH